MTTTVSGHAIQRFGCEQAKAHRISCIVDFCMLLLYFLLFNQTRNYIVHIQKHTHAPQNGINQQQQQQQQNTQVWKRLCAYRNFSKVSTKCMYKISTKPIFNGGKKDTHTHTQTHKQNKQNNSIVNKHQITQNGQENGN